MLNTNRIIDRFETVPELGADLSRRLFLDERRDIVTIRDSRLNGSDRRVHWCSSGVKGCFYLNKQLRRCKTHIQV